MKSTKKDIQKRARQQLQSIPAGTSVARGAYSFGTSGYGTKVIRHVMPVSCKLTCAGVQWCGFYNWFEL